MFQVREDVGREVKTLALCLNLPELQAGFDNPEVCSRYPGAGFLPHLAKLARDKDWFVASGHGLLREQPGERIYVLQEELNKDGTTLVSHGAKAQVLFCMESKMYAPDFYDRLPEFKKTFKHQILFQGGTRKLRFPNFEEEILMDPLPSTRKPLCMIASNKQWWSQRTRFDSPSWCEAISYELHTARLQAIADYDLDLYGYGWDNLDNLPPWWNWLKPKIKACCKGTIPADGKLDVLRQYKQAICYENTSLPGYVTEKIVDCLVAGTEPIYLGPKGMTTLGHQELKLHSFQAFAETVMGCLEDE